MCETGLVVVDRFHDDAARVDEQPQVTLRMFAAEVESTLGVAQTVGFDRLGATVRCKLKKLDVFFVVPSRRRTPDDQHAGDEAVGEKRGARGARETVAQPGDGEG